MLWALGQVLNGKLGMYVAVQTHIRIIKRKEEYAGYS